MPNSSDAKSPINFDHPANVGVLAYLKKVGDERLVSSPPVYGDYGSVGGTHPDLVDILWAQMPKELPENCQWIAYGRPILLHKSSGIIFGFAIGTSLIGLRLPPTEREVVIKNNPKSLHHQWGSGETISAQDLGEDWVFAGLSRQTQNCLHAYEYTVRIP
ncbi:MAG: hypothetical protein HY862_12940 [Chloroflexi bacterium]|nr:hypothetical protein [Chloroflexota bacterium]